ncbi:hypothetical protein O181_050623 [Austropuccinia psidii MF-1]|uniref:CCHC-type domain-containing protein n=1 Tax=Austropuccinia psidii MF-1 TaxID=1389203 RepID=A0A9Q3HMJ2_9BASI|nr:hypothetical protein [Austropuccinia psidii MF-1]
MSDSLINIKISMKCGGELEHNIKCRFIEPCSTENYISSMEDIITRTTISKTCTRSPIYSKIVPNTSIEDRRPQIPVLKCNKCGSTSHLSKTCTKKTKINESQVIKEVQCAKEKEESEQYFAVSEDIPTEDYHIEKITEFFEFTEVHTHLPQYLEDFYKVTNIQYSRMCKTKPARGKGYTSGSLCTIREHDVDITFNIDRPYPPVPRRPAYPGIPSAREALEKHIQELMKLGVLRKVAHNKEVEVTTPVIISWNNDKSRMVADFRELNTYTVPERYPIPRIQEASTQLSKYK